MTPSQIPYGMSDEELVGSIGPSWSSMSQAERERYGPRGEYIPPLFTVAQVSIVNELLAFALEWSFLLPTEGLAAPAKRLGLREDAVLLAGILDGSIDERAAAELQHGIYLPEPNAARAVGAHAHWRERVLAGVDGQDIRRPATWRLDVLHHAACLERAGMDELHAGPPNIADGYFKEAAVLFLEWKRMLDPVGR